MKTQYLFLSLAFSLITTFANADVTPVTATASAEASPRMNNRLGAYLGIGDPSPGLVGLNVTYNAFDFLRVSAGYAQVSTSLFGIESSATTIGGGVRGVVPGWQLTPALGMHAATVNYSGTGTLEVGGFRESGGHVYATAGIDYQAKGGFYGGTGLSQSFKSGIGSSWYLNLGWFFDPSF